MSANEPCATPISSTSTTHDTRTDDESSSDVKRHVTITSSGDLPVGCQNTLTLSHYPTSSEDQEDPGAGKNTTSEVCNPPHPQGHDLEYGITDVPPIGLSFIYILQISFSIVGGPITNTYFLYSTLCADDNEMLLAQMMSTTLFMVGAVTFIQCTVGIRLPIIQGSTIIYILPALSLVSSGVWSCPNDAGGIILASLVHTCMGVFGLVGLLMNYVGPLTVGSMLTGMVFDVTTPVSRACSRSWLVALVSASLGLIVSLGLEKVKVPCPRYDSKEGCRTLKWPIFKLYPMMIAFLGGWIFCTILTVSGYFPEDTQAAGYQARADAKLGNLHKSSWIYIPYPGQFGWPTFTMSMFISMLAATVASIIDSIGDYGICTRVCLVQPPPRHAVNRGIAIEGISTLLSGLIGAGHATTTYTGTMGLMALTKMCSLRIYQLCGLFLVVLGVFGKVGAVFSIIPAPVIGGSGIIAIGMMASFAVSTLQACDMSTTRNRMIYGVATVLSLTLSKFIKFDPRAVHSGYSLLDQIGVMFLSSCMVLSGVIAVILDNIIPGTRKSRGFPNQQPQEDNPQLSDSTMYDFPCGMSLMRRWRMLSYVPCLPVYVGQTCARRKQTSGGDEDQ